MLEVIRIKTEASLWKNNIVYVSKIKNRQAIKVQEYIYKLMFEVYYNKKRA